MSKNTINTEEELIKTVVSANKGTTAEGVKKLFMWYDLFGLALTFQMLFIFAYLMKLDNAFTATIFSVEAVIAVESVLRTTIEKDAKSYTRLKSQLSLVQLWTVPLIVLGIITTMTLFAVKTGALG